MKDINQLQIGKPAECYPFKDEQGFVFLPLKSTNLTLSFIGTQEQHAEIINYWNKIGSPAYKKDKTNIENILELKRSLRKLPKPLFNNGVIQTLKLEYEYDR